MLEYLDRLVSVDVPNDHETIGTYRKQIWRAGIFWTPVYLEDVGLVKVVPLLVWL